MSFLSRHPSLLVVAPVSLFLGMLVMLEIGRRAKARVLARDPQGSNEGVGALEGSIFGLLGLLIAFTFAGAASRYDERRELVVQEANLIGDVWARIDTLPPETQPALRDGMRRYLEARLETYRRLPDLPAAMVQLRRSNEIQDEIWRAAVAACAMPDGQRLTMLVLPALDAAFDMTLVRTAAAMHHPPAVVFGMLIALALASALIAGYGMKRRQWPYMIGFALTTAAAVYTILEIEFPRIGLIRVDAVDQLLEDVLAGMKK